MNYNFLNGITTALVTPFNNNKIDFEKLELVVNNQVKAKISSILLFGTTGETYSLSFSEKKSIFLAVKQFAPKMPIIAGVSHPSTDECIKDCKRMLKLGADAVMVTTPYFYKTLNIGIISHFSKIASCINLPLIAYNVPTRTGCDISSNEQILNELSKIKNLVAIKQASLNLSLCKSISNKYNFLSLCGNDSYILELLKIGYSGAISVLSNVFPERLVSVYNKVKEQDFNSAELMFNEIYQLISSLEKIPNPIGIKYLCYKMLNFKNELRLPLINLSENEAKQLNLTLNNLLEVKI